MDQFRQDLQYVRGVVEKKEALSLPKSIPILWAIICGIGLALQDFSPSSVAVFWMCAVPIGFVLSAVMGALYCRERELSGWSDAKQLLHWLTIPVAIGLLFYIIGMRSSPQVLGAQMSLLIVAMVYFLAGLHLNRVWLFGGSAMVVCIIGIPFLPGYPFAATGVTVAAALLFGAFAKGSRKGEL